MDINPLIADLNKFRDELIDSISIARVKGVGVNLIIITPTPFIYDFLQSHEEYVAVALCNAERRQAWWSESRAVGDESFVETIKQRLRLRAKGRKVKEAGDGYQFRENVGIYIADYTAKNCTIDRYSAFFAGDNLVYSEL